MYMRIRKAREELGYTREKFAEKLDVSVSYLAELERGAVLRISRNTMTRWPLSVGRTGRVQEYSMRYEVTMQLTDADGAPVVPRQDIQLERSYQFETLRAQGTPGEEEVVRAELERDMAQAILRRIDAVLAGR